MKVNLKPCDGDKCNGKLQIIWKNQEGKRYCRACWSAHSVKSSIKKPTSVQKRIHSRSSKRAKQEKEYSVKRREFLEKHSMCQAHIPGICTQMSTDIHHKCGRVGDLLLDIQYWLAACRSCHTWIENNPAKAKELGFSVSRIN
jgi:hypothetical protein